MRISLGQAYSFHQLGTRENQEDSRWPDCNQPALGQRFFVVCDGVGGSEGGEIASQTVCKAFGRSLSVVDFDGDFTNEDFSRCLDDAYDALDRLTGSETSEMATTLTFAAFHGGGATLAHIGDSRIYQIRPSVGIVYRSDDHSLVNQMVHSGILTPEEAEHHPQRNVITRYMSPVTEDQSRCMATVMRTKDVKAGDYFLLCTDGVLHRFSDEQIVDLLSTNQPDDQKIHEMARRCEDSSDNNTAYLIYINKVEDDADMIPADTAEDSHETRRSRSGHQGIEEIESIQQTSNGNIISQWLKRIFS